MRSYSCIFLKNNAKPKLNQRSKTQIYSFKSTNKADTKTEPPKCDLIGTTTIPITITDLQDDDYFSQINSNLQKKKSFTNSITKPEVVLAKDATNSISNTSEQLDDELSRKLNKSVISIASNVRVKLDSSFEQQRLQPSKLNNHTTVCIECKPMLNSFQNIDPIQNDAISIDDNNDPTNNVSRRTSFEKSHSPSITTNKKASDTSMYFPFGANNFEIHGEYQL